MTNNLTFRPRKHGKNSELIEQQRARIADLEAVTEAQQKRIEELQNELAMANDKAAFMQRALDACMEDLNHDDR